MKKNLVVALVVAGVIAGYWYFSSSRESTPVNGPPVTHWLISGEKTNAGSGEPIASPALPPNVATNATAVMPAAAEGSNLAAGAVMLAADTNVPGDLPPQTLLENVRRAVRQYGQMFGGDPVGTNPEITAALTGKNPKHINFLSGLPGTPINDQGEMVDAWGTPYFFHQISGSEMEIHSAGPDKVMWTSDDLVVK